MRLARVYQVNPDFKKQLAQVFGLRQEAELEALIAKLRAGEAVDADLLRKGCLAFVDSARETPAAHVDARLKVALRASNLGLWEWDLTTGNIFVDRTYFGFLGLDRDDQVMPITDLVGLVSPEDLQVFREAIADAVRGKLPLFQVQHRMLHADGRWVWLETSGSVSSRDANGRATRMTGTNSNVTERKQLERALSNTLRVLRALLETLPLPVILRDAERRVTLVNDAFEKMTGIPRQEIIGKPLDDYSGRIPVPNHRETDDELIAERKSLRYETSLMAADGTIFDVIVAKTPLLAEDGTITGIASVLTDISDQKRTAEFLEKARVAAEAAVQAKSRFLANMSHELRTPLNGVVGMASLLENTALDAKQRRFVRTLKSSAEALITLINDVLDLSKAEAGKLTLANGPFELRRELEQVIGLFGARAYDKGIEIAAHIARGVPAVVHGDPVRLRQVLGNLVNNAVKFTDAGAVLLAVTAVAGDRGPVKLEFSVTDTGLGIAPAEQQRIFDAFEQADGSVTRKFGGTGLGLAISRQLVELMRGTMDLTSESGRGSRFSFRIPIDVQPLELPPVTPAADLGAIVIGLHPVIRSAVCDAISIECSHVISVDSLIVAVEALQDFGARITRLRVVIDSNATANLEHSVSALRAAAAPRQVDVVALLPPDADAAPPNGIHRVFVKPLCTTDLVAAAAVDTAQSTRIRALPMSGSRGRALVVEDNAVNQEMARAMLDMLGFRVTTASNGREGVVAAAADPDLDLILMDCQMPVMDGLAAARAIRAAESPGFHVPIVALTGNAMPGDREACVAAGMDDYLAKPFSLTALRAMIDRWAGVSADRSSDAHAPR
ncbi:MAG TPA: ATP-binding protein [Steroidobacteraceae bacterium]|nr:ATP-binding protein [Steroidobacteraceae bacterium]